MGLSAHVKKSCFDVSYQLETTLSPSVVIPISYHRFWPGELMTEQIFGSFMIQTLSVDVMDEIEGWCITAVCSDYDLYDDAYKVLGDRKSLEDNNTYRLPYIVNQVAPLMGQTLEEPSFNANLSLFNYATGEQITRFTKNATYMSDDTLGPSDYNGVATQFLYNNRTYNVPYSLNWWYLSPVSNQQANARDIISNNRFFKSMLPTQKGLSLVHYLSGVVGDTLKPLNALPYIFYYLYCDTYHRHTKYQSCFVSEDPRIDKNFMCTRTGADNFKTPSLVRVHGTGFYPNGFVCTKYDEEQRVLSRFLNACCVNNSDVVTSGEYNKFIYSTCSSFALRNDNENILDSKYYAQFFAFTHGGLYPLLGRPDYVNMLFDTPQQGDPVKLFSDDILNINTQASLPQVPVIQDGDITLTDGNVTGVNKQVYATINTTSSNFNLIRQDINRNVKYVSGLKTQAVDDVDISLEIPNLYNLTIDELRMKFQLNKYLVRANIAGSFIGDIYKAMYGTTISDSKLRLPRIVQASKIKFNNIPVVQTGASEGTEALQGNISANSVASLKTAKTKIYSSEFGYSMTFIFFGSKQIRHSFYEKDTFEFSHFDLWNPLFNFLSFEAVTKAQVFNPIQNDNLYNSDETKPELYYQKDYITTDLYSQGYRFDFSKSILGTLLTGTDEEKESAMNKLNHANDVRGYSERYGYKRYAMNKSTGYFDPRLQSVSSIDPRMSKPYVANSILSFTDADILEYSAKTATFNDLVPAANITEWTLTRNYDEEDRSFIQTLNVPGLLDNTPWTRAFQLPNTQPIYAKLYFARKITVGLPVFAIPGYADHF